MELQKVSDEVKELASEVLCKHETHKPLLDAKVRIDYFFAYPNKDTDGNYVGDALKLHGVKCNALAKVNNYEKRFKGQGDCEVLIDGEWWEEHTGKQERRALLDHELHHFDVRKDADDGVAKDKLSRPLLRMRRHDVQFGWFALVAARNGEWSQERIQAKGLIENETYHQAFWPTILTPLATKPEEKKEVAAA